MKSIMTLILLSWLLFFAAILTNNSIVFFVLYGCFAVCGLIGGISLLFKVFEKPLLKLFDDLKKDN